MAVSAQFFSVVKKPVFVSVYIFIQNGVRLHQDPFTANGRKRVEITKIKEASL